MEEIRASEAILLTTKMLIQKANIIAKELKINSSFQCSESWIQRFKKRYSICKGSRSQCLSQLAKKYLGIYPIWPCR
jgi:hypothetical protein